MESIRTYLGTYQAGAVIPLRVQCRDSYGTPTTPDRAPWVRIVDQFGVVIEMIPGLGTEDVENVTGLFAQRHRILSYGYTPGYYSVLYNYLISGQLYSTNDRFQLVAGGDLGGTVISCYSQHHPEANYVLAQITSGLLVAGFGPKLI